MIPRVLTHHLLVIDFDVTRWSAWLQAAPTGGAVFVDIKCFNYKEWDATQGSDTLASKYFREL